MKKYIGIGIVLISVIAIFLFQQKPKEKTKIENLNQKADIIVNQQTDLKELKDIHFKLLSIENEYKKGIGVVRALTIKNRKYQYYDSDNLLLKEGNQTFLQNIHNGKITNFEYTALKLPKIDRKDIDLKELELVIPKYSSNLKFNKKEVGDLVFSLYTKLNQGNFFKTVGVISIYEYRNQLLTFIGSNDKEYIIFSKNNEHYLTDLTGEEFKKQVLRFKKAEKKKLENPYQIRKGPSDEVIKP